ncbi:glycosyltransferase [Pseudomonas sp. NPDC089406]|uniref:glycosyltransferase n=1 Tax=Pseudomonas sp. NPDC089406 TaxID=3364463 RepID=UPI00384DFDF3
MQRILLLSFSTLLIDPRVRRHASALAGKYHVVTAGYGAAPGYGDEHVQVPQPAPSSYVKKALKAASLLLRAYSPVYWLDDDKRAAVELLKGQAFDLIIANDASSLPVAFALAGDTVPVIVDMHEYAPGEQVAGWKWKYFWRGYPTYLCRRFLPRAAHVVTVCDSIAGLYQREFLSERPSVVMNCPQYIEAQPRPVGEHIRLVHHGVADPTRQLELMAQAVLMLDDRFTLDFMLMGTNQAYLDSLKQQYQSSRIRFRDPVPMPLIAQTLNEQYDVGIYLLADEAINCQFALPNKLFEYMQARLALAISPNHEMAALVNATGIGVVSEDFTPAALARVLQGLDAAKIESMKQASHEAASTYSSGAIYHDFQRRIDAAMG